MFESFLVNTDSLRNESKDNKTIGFSFEVRIANYRGVYLSLHNGYFVEMDGIEYPVTSQSFEINGKSPRSFDEIKKAVTEHWDYDDDARLHIALPGGLAEGVHSLRIQQSVLAAYGYQPTDEAWVKEVPKPGTGAGSDKMPEIVSFQPELKVA